MTLTVKKKWERKQDIKNTETKNNPENPTKNIFYQIKVTNQYKKHKIYKNDFSISQA